MTTQPLSLCGFHFGVLVSGAFFDPWILGRGHLLARGPAPSGSASCKDAGNRAMGLNDVKGAERLYSAALCFDSASVAALLNRALARTHLTPQAFPMNSDHAPAAAAAESSAALEATKAAKVAAAWP